MNPRVTDAFSSKEVQRIFLGGRIPHTMRVQAQNYVEGNDRRCGSKIHRLLHSTSKLHSPCTPDFYNECLNLCGGESS